MTENNTLTDVKRDAKAQAAADKAYRKASRPWFKKKRFILPLILVIIIIISSVSNSGNKKAADAVSVPAAGQSAQAADKAAAAPAPASPAAVPSPAAAAAAAAFPGAKKDDVIGQAGDALKLGDVTVTSAAIVNGDATLGATLCTPVSLSNGSKGTIDFNTYDWKLQSPGGTIVDPTIVGSENMLRSGQLVSGGSTTGDVCFDNKTPESGKYVVLYSPMFKLFSSRAAWINTL